MGDGALNQGATHEAMNLASVYNLPLIFVLENNGYSMGTDIARGTVHGPRPDANGPRCTACATSNATARTCWTPTAPSKWPSMAPATPGRSTTTKRPANASDLPTYHKDGRTPGPAYVNVKTYRYQGHSMSDPQKYRSKDEVGEKQDVDCINRLVNWLIENDKATQDQIDKLDNQAKQVSKDAIKFAEESPELGMDELYTDVYKNVFGPYQRGEAHPEFR